MSEPGFEWTAFWWGRMGAGHLRQDRTLAELALVREGWRQRGTRLGLLSGSVAWDDDFYFETLWRAILDCPDPKRPSRAEWEYARQRLAIKEREEAKARTRARPRPRSRLPRSMPLGLRFSIFVRDRFRCVYCGASPDRSMLRVDHVHPVARGGTNDPSNLVTACNDCNAGKASRLLEVRP